MIKPGEEFNIKSNMSSNVISLNDGAPIKEAYKLMKGNNCKLVLVKKNQVFIGVVTEREIIFDALLTGIDVSKTNVSKIMSPNIISIDEEKYMEDAVTLMRKENVTNLPVTRKGEIVGMIWFQDLKTFYVNQRKRFFN